MIGSSVDFCLYERSVKCRTRFPNNISLYFFAWIGDYCPYVVCIYTFLLVKFISYRKKLF